MGSLLTFLVFLFSLRMKKDVPDDYKEEMKGILEGCRKANPRTRVRAWRIWVLNTGVDAILSMIYTGKLGIFRPLHWSRHHHPRLPIMCNAFAVWGELTQYGDVYYGRDFMFPTAGVFQLCAVQMVHRPDQGLLFTGITAPGMVGLMTGMNQKQIAMGVNMIPACNCSPRRPGLNSLLMVRHVIDKESSLEGAEDRIENTRRGVSWLYSIADGSAHRAAVVEAGMTKRHGGFLRHIPPAYRKLLPTREYLRANPSTEFRRGIMVRRPGCDVTEKYLGFNKGLFDYHREKNPDYLYVYDENDFAPDGQLDDTWFEKNCPGAKYFPSQKYSNPQGILVTNFYTIPEMRLYQMAALADILSKDNQDDFQWRYDTLNHLLPKSAAGKIDFDQARAIINFLDPRYACKNFRYYSLKAEDKDHIRVEGSVSIINATRLYMETLIGYYGDDWVRLDLNDFLERA